MATKADNITAAAVAASRQPTFFYASVRAPLTFLTVPRQVLLSLFLGFFLQM
jgi:hypothetical protein